jgi:hypothetical protein
MAFNLEKMTVDYKTMYRMVPSDRFKVAQSGTISDLISSLTPGQLVNLFPRYYRDRLPDIGTTTSLGGALSGGSSYRPNQSTSYGPTPSPVVKKQLTPEEKAVQEAIAEAGLLGSGAVASGTGELKDGRQQRIKMTYDAFTSAGFSHKQATALTAEVGRENSFQEKFMFGTHSDPYNNATNLGMLSMQGPRLTALKEHLMQEGRFAPDGELMSDQETMNSMARFYMKEMTSSENTEKTKEFLSNPDIDPERAAYLLGTGYIRWRYNDPTYTQHHEYRNQFYSETEKITSQFELAADKIKDLETVITKFEPGMLDKLDKRLQDHYKSASTQQQGMMERVIAKIGVEKFNEIMQKQPVNTATLQATSDRFSVLKGNIDEVNPKLQNVINAASGDLPAGYSVKAISGRDARATGTKNHPAGLAMDVQIYDGEGNLVPHNSNSPGWKYYEMLYRSAHLRGQEMYPADKFIWGGAWISDAAGRGDPMHYQIVDPTVPGTSTSSGRYSIEGGLDPSHPFVREGGQLSQKEREEFDASILAKIQAEKNASDPVTAAQSNMAPSTPPTAQLPPVEIPPAVAAPGLSAGGTVPMTPGENIAGINTTTGKVEFMSNDRELYTKDDQGNLRVDPSTIRQDEQPAPPVQETQRPEPVQPLQSKPQQPMPVSTPDPNFLETMSSGSMASSPSQLRALNRAKLYSENSSGLVNGHFS